MADIQVVTSFSPKGYEIYGRRFVSTFLQHWPKDVLLWIGIEGEWPGLKDPRMRTFNLDADPDLQNFIHYTRRYHGGDSLGDYRRQPVKFAKKVFSLTQPHLWSPDAHGAKWWVWIDADVETHADVTHEWLAQLLDPKASVIYIGRPSQAHSETGFMAFHVETEEAQRLLVAMRSFYVVADEPRVFSLDHWHDSMVFDAARRELGVKRAKSLNDRIGSHVWPGTVLGAVMRHHKGPRRKIQRYGEKV